MDWLSDAQATTSNLTANIQGWTFTGGSSAVDYNFGATDVATNSTDGATFSFIYKASDQGGNSSLAEFNHWSNQRIFLNTETWNNTGQFGATVAAQGDYVTTGSTAPSVWNQDVMVTFRGNGGATPAEHTLDIFVNGVLKGTLTKDGIYLTGGAGKLGSNLNGTVYGVASYSAALSNAQILQSYNAWQSAVPEPSVAMLGGLGALALLRRKRA